MRFFSTLHDVGFDGWISIEDGVDGLAQLQESVSFLRGKIAEHWPAGSTNAVCRARVIDCASK